MSATKINRMVGARVEAEFPLSFADRHTWDAATGKWRERTPAEMARQYEAMCEEFHEFIRDHRSQDSVSLAVIREYEDQCSACGNPWETTAEGGVEYCAYCGEPVAAEGQERAA